MLLCPTAECKMRQLSGCARRIWHLLAWLCSARNLLFLTSTSCPTEPAAAKLLLCLNANLRHVFQMAAELQIISQHWRLPTLHMPAELYALSPGPCWSLSSCNWRRQGVARSEPIYLILISFSEPPRHVIVTPLFRVHPSTFSADERDVLVSSPCFSPAQEEGHYCSSQSNRDICF